MCYARFFRYNGHDYAIVVNGWDTDAIICKFWVIDSTELIEKIDGKSSVTRNGNLFKFYMPSMDVVWLKMKRKSSKDHHTPFNGDNKSLSLKVVPSCACPCYFFVISEGV